jgi:ribosomal-protein-alanine N-acetyltransferase
MSRGTPMQLKGQRVVLREFEHGDATVLAAIHSDPRVMRYYAPEVATLEHAQMLVARFIEWANENPRRNFQLAIADAATAELLGSCGVRSAQCPPGKAEFGVGIGSSAWGKGIAHEAVRLLFDFAFAELALHEIYGVAVAENEAVTKFAQRLGLVQRPARHNEAWMSERNWNAVEWVITRAAWH